MQNALYKFVSMKHKIGSNHFENRLIDYIYHRKILSESILLSENFVDFEDSASLYWWEQIAGFFKEDTDPAITAIGCSILK